MLDPTAGPNTETTGTEPGKCRSLGNPRAELKGVAWGGTTGTRQHCPPGSSPTGLLSATLLGHLHFFTWLPPGHPSCVVHRLLSGGGFAKPTGATVSWAAGLHIFLSRGEFPESRQCI